MLIKALGFICLAKAHKDENGEEIRSDPLVDPNFYIDQLIAMKEKTSESRLVPHKVPVVFDNYHAVGNWTSTDDDACSYVEQPDGSILISTGHLYNNFDYCHEYWECDNPNHNMFYKWNRVQIESQYNCRSDWARFAWGTADDEQEFTCEWSNNLSKKQKTYRDTGGNKIVWDFDSDDSVIKWGVEAQIICKDPSDKNKCLDGNHNCSDDAECVKIPGKGFKCQCPSDIKWGDQTLKFTGAGTISDPCKSSHPKFPETEIFPIEWDGETLGVVFEKTTITWQDAFNRCNELGMTLPLPSNDDQNTALSKFLLGSERNRRSHIPETYQKRIFLGAHNSYDKRNWVNLYTNETITYNQWSTGQPDNAGNTEKVAEMWSDDGDWNDISLENIDYRSLLCINVGYENWDTDDMNMGNFFCETGLNRCHATAVCVPTGKKYQCECDEIQVQGNALKPISGYETVYYDRKCEYVLTEFGVVADIYIYDGQPTIFRQTYSLTYDKAVKYCASMRMHLPVPNTEQQYEDLKNIPRDKRWNSYWLGYTDAASEGTWVNIYNGEELAIDKWGIDQPDNDGSGQDQVEMYQYGSFQWNDIDSSDNSYRSTLCMMTDLEIKLDSCRMNLHECTPGATCISSGQWSYTCACPNVQIGVWDLQPASTSTGKGHDGCHYFHPNFEGHRLFPVSYGGRNTVAYLGPAAGSNFYDYAAKCQSLGMRMLTPDDKEDWDSLIGKLRLKPGGKWAYPGMYVPLGIIRRNDGEWRNIYTYNKTWTNFNCKNSYCTDFDGYGNRDFAFGSSYSAYYSPESGFAWYDTNFGFSTCNLQSCKFNARTICIAPQDGESTDIDFCGTGFNDCHEGASCTNGGDDGYICECQPLQFGDVKVEPVDSAGTGKSCTYNMPGHDDKTLLPVRVRDNASSDIVYAFHVSSDKHLLKDAIMYCGALGMHLPLPKNDNENAAMRKVRPGQYMRYYWLGYSRSGEDLKFRNIYTGEEELYTNWAVNEPKVGTKLTNVAMLRESGKWTAYADITNHDSLRTICQKGVIDVSKFDWCAAGLHDCHADADCMSSDDENTSYQCQCKDKEFYTGNGIGVNGCVFKLGSKFFIDNYNVDVSINERYVRTQIAVSVANKNTNIAELYEFGVNLDEFEFISGLTMRIGDDGPVSIGDVHKEQEAEEIFETVISSGSGGAITEIKPTEAVSTEILTSRNTTFSVKVNVPAGKKLYIWLNYDMQLARKKAFYAYTTNVFPYDAVSKMRVSVTIEESRNIDAERTAVYWESNGIYGGPESARNQDNAFTLIEAGAKKWKFSFEKQSIDVEQWNDNLKIEYDLERLDNTCGDIVMRDGYFIHYIAPKGLDSIPKNVILTVDTSGSMGWTRMNNAKAAMITILDTLTGQDTFWLQEFNSITSSWRSDTVQATGENIENAKTWVNSLSAGGGTALYSAIFNSVERPLDSNRANLAFIISDGYPTSGITSWSDIQANILAANSIKNSQGDEIAQKWAIYNFGIGNGAPMFELSKLSTWNMGVGRQVFDNADVQSQLTEFFNEYSIPLVWNNQFHYSGASEFDCSGTNLYADQELTCIGKLPTNNKCGDVDDLGFTPGDTLLAGVNMMDVSVSLALFLISIFFNHIPIFQTGTCKIVSDAGCSSGINAAPAYDSSDLMANPNPKSSKPDLAKVFAYQQIQRKIRLYHDSYVENVKDLLKADIEDFALMNDFVTEFTTLVVVEATRRNRPVDGVMIKKRRSKEKQHKLKELFSEYREEIKRLKAMEQVISS